jgi:hypothetical protein
MPVSNIATPDIMKVLTPIWNAKVETASRVRQRLSNVLEWARAAWLPLRRQPRRPRADSRADGDAAREPQLAVTTKA